jgi:hypothetical protein
MKMDKFWLFRELLDFVADRADVIEADMSNYCGDIEIAGDDGEKTIKIVVSIKDKNKEETV